MAENKEVKKNIFRKYILNRRVVYFAIVFIAFILGMLINTFFINVNGNVDMNRLFLMSDKIYSLSLMSVTFLSLAIIALSFFLFRSRIGIFDAYKRKSMTRYIMDTGKIIETSHVPMLILDAETYEILSYNDAAYDNLGLGNFMEDGKSKKDIVTLFALVDSAMTDSDMLSVLSRDKEVKDVQVTLRIKNKEVSLAKMSTGFVGEEGKRAIALSLDYLSPDDYSENKIKIIYDLDENTGLVSKESGRKFLQEVFDENASTDINILIAVVKAENIESIGYIHGYKESDWYLKAVAGAIKMNIRSDDLAIRESKDEVMFMVRNCSMEEGSPLIERVRNSIVEVNRKNRKPYKMNIRSGMCDRNEDEGITLDEMIEVAYNRLDLDIEENKK